MNLNDRLVAFELFIGVIAVVASVVDGKWTHEFVPYNGMGPELFGEENGPYNATNPLRQHLHIYQADESSNEPTPVYFYAHANGGTADNINEYDLYQIASAGYSVISWESVSQLDSANGDLDILTSEDDFDLLWDWFHDHADVYNFDTDTVIIGGRSRGSIVSWQMAHSQRAGIKGIYMYNALPDMVWGSPGSYEAWVKTVTEGSPPAYLVYGPECPKPIEQDCIPTPLATDNFGNPTIDSHNPRNGQTIVDRYKELGMSANITLIDGLTNNNISVYELFPAFAESLEEDSDDDDEPMITTCRSLGSIQKVKQFCTGRVDEDSIYPTFWELDRKLTKEEILDQECPALDNTCTKIDCCKEGRKRKCSNTDHKGKKKPFKENKCDEGSVLVPTAQLKKRRCTGSNGEKCLSEDCCTPNLE